MCFGSSGRQSAGEVTESPVPRSCVADESRLRCLLRSAHSMAWRFRKDRGCELSSTHHAESFESSITILGSNRYARA